MIKVIAEIGCNHCGDMDLAKEMAKAAGVEEAEIRELNSAIRKVYKNVKNLVTGEYGPVPKTQRFYKKNNISTIYFHFLSLAILQKI